METKTTLPTYEDVMLPLLKSFSDGEVHSLSDAVDEMANHFSITDSERKVLLPSGKYPIFRSRVSWAKTYLLKSELISSVKRAHFKITEEGSKLLTEGHDKIDKSVLAKYNGYWRFTKPDAAHLTDSGRWDIEGAKKQIKAFKKLWPLEKLKDLTLETYTNLDRETSFIYWLESKTNKAGGIAGGSAYKFIIFKRSNTNSKIENPQYKTDGEYSWISKYGETKEEVFAVVKKEVVKIATAADAGNFALIDDSIFGNAIKWKIAYLYNTESVIPIFKKETINNACIGYGIENVEKLPGSTKNEMLLSHKPSEEDTVSYAKLLWDKFNSGSIYYILKTFLNQAETSDLATKGNYPKKYQDLRLNVSFGKGMPAKVPWIGLTDKNNTIQKGIYPSYLYNKDKGILMLNYGVSATYEPEVSWPDDILEDSVTDYFQKEYNEAPDNYGSAYVYKVYEDIDSVPLSELQNDIDAVINAYKEISYDEVDGESENDTSSYDNMWMIAAGTDGSNWEEWLNNSIINIGWDGLGDLSKYDSQTLMAEKLRELRDSNTSQNNNAKACYQFAKEMNIGDYVIAKKGKDTIYGIGKVTSDYLYNKNKTDHKSYRKVDWLNTGTWKVERHLVQKTLTVISQYPGYAEEMLNLLLQNAIEETASTQKPYTFANLNRDSFIDETSLKKLLDLLQHKKNIILQGPPGTGKTFIAKRLAYTKMGVKDDSKVKMVQFHQSYAYEDFIQGLRPNEDGNFHLSNGVFYRFCEQAKENPESEYFFIIDEINRGNLSKIFGELMMLIESDKRGPEFKISLTYSKKNQQFYIPENLYIIGTMNTADRSLALVDYALRRRFMFYTMTPQFGDKFKSFLKDAKLPSSVISKIISNIKDLNNTIASDKDLGRGFTIGQSYFCNTPTDAHEEWLSSIYRYEIIPLLEEYWFDKPSTVETNKEKLLH